MRRADSKLRFPIIRPEDHISKEQEHFQNGYVRLLRQKLRFRPEIETKVRKTIKKVAKKMGKKPKGEETGSLT